MTEHEEPRQGGSAAVPVLEPAVNVDILDAPQAGATAVRGSLVRSLGYVISIGLSLISAPLLVRHLGIDDFGAYVTITAVVTVMGGVSDIGLTSVGVRELATREPDQRKQLMSDLLGARLALTTVGIAAAMGFGLLAGYNSVRLLGLALACGGLLAQALQSTLGIPLQAGLRQGWVAGAEILRQGAQVFLLLLLIALGAGLAPLLGTALPAGVAAAIMTAIVARRSLVRPSWHPHAWWELLRDTLPFATASALSVVYLRTTVIITSLVANAAQTGYFAAAFRVMEVLIGVPVLLIGALFPIFARAAATDRARLQAAIQSTWDVALAGGSLMALSVLAGAPVAILVLLGHRPAAAVDALRILGVGLGCSFIGATCQFALLALRAHRSILVINAVALATNLALSLVLVSADGARGAAIALTCSEAVVALLSTVALIRAQQSLRLRLGIVPRVGVAIAAAAIAIVLLHPLGILAVGIGAPLVYMAVAVAARAVPEGVWSLLPRRARLS